MTLGFYVAIGILILIQFPVYLIVSKELPAVDVRLDLQRDDTAYIRTQISIIKSHLSVLREAHYDKERRRKDKELFEKWLEERKCSDSC